MVENVALPVITDLDERDRAGALPMPAEGPLWQRVRGTHGGNLVCGKCLRVVGDGVSMLDVLGFAKHERRLLVRCSCGTHLQVPAQHGVGLFPIGEALKGVSPASRQANRGR